MESILTSIKKLLGIQADCPDFDTDIVMHINTAFFTLNQIGAGPEKCFSIKDANATWSDFIGDSTDLEAVKTYVYLKVRMVFDPPMSSIVADSVKEMIKEQEWRILVSVDPPKTEEQKEG